MTRFPLNNKELNWGFSKSCHVFAIVTRFAQCREHVFDLLNRVTFSSNRETFSFFVLSSVFLLFLLLKLPCELQNVIKIHIKLRNDEVSLGLKKLAAKKVLKIQKGFGVSYTMKEVPIIEKLVAFELVAVKYKVSREEERCA